jgi:glutamine synthetase
MLRTHVIPGAVRYQTELAEAVAATRSAGLESADLQRRLKAVIEMIDELGAAIDAIDKAVARYPADAERRARHVRDKLLPAMDRARAASDALEEVIPDDLWPLPTYAEMLFVR